MSCDDDSASACLLAFFDLIYLIQTLTLVGFLELLSKIIITDSPNVHHRFRGKNILSKKKKKEGKVAQYKTSESKVRLPTYCSTSGGVLGGPTSNVGHFMPLSEFIVASDNALNQQQEEQEKKSRSYIPACFSSAKIASSAFKPYF